jgi:polyhydroxyalkanoate synthesis repressor PhaR
MPLIKRYSNRKLYDTQARHYITLEGIAELIRQGQNVQVMDHATGEDLTAITLTQIILDQEKKQTGFLPRSILAGMIQAGGERLTQLQRDLASQLTFLLPVDEEIKRRVHTLVRRGEIAEAEGKRLLEKLLELGVNPIYNHIPPGERLVEAVLEKRLIPTREDLERVSAQLDALSSELEQLTKTQS